MQTAAEDRVNILLVDDRQENLQALEAILSDLGENLVYASSGQEALKHVLKTEFAAILLDVRMPGMDGLETAALIRQRDRTQYTPIIFVTAFGESDEQVKKGYALGAVDFLFKPIVPEIIRSKIAVFVDLYRKAEEIRRTGEILRATQLQAHERQLAEERQRWEAEQLRKEVELEREVSAKLQESYRRLQELEKLRDDLTSMIVHDLRSPLASLITGLEMMESLGDLNEEQEEMLRLSVLSGRNLLRLIGDLLDISKLEAGSLKLELEGLDAAAMVQDSVCQLESLAREKSITLEVEISGPLPCFEADPDKLSRTLTNLIGNGVKFTPRGGRITVGVRLQESEGSLLFWVKDTGEGIPPDSLEHIFEKFGQVENRKAGRRMSTGLGLTFCKMIIEAHGGRIWVDSAMGQGSTFSFALPVNAANRK